MCLFTINIPKRLFLNKFYWWSKLYKTEYIVTLCGGMYFLELRFAFVNRRVLFAREGYFGAIDIFFFERSSK